MHQIVHMQSYAIAVVMKLWITIITYMCMEITIHFNSFFYELANSIAISLGLEDILQKEKDPKLKLFGAIFSLKLTKNILANQVQTCSTNTALIKILADGKSKMDSVCWISVTLLNKLQFGITLNHVYLNNGSSRSGNRQ